MIIYKITHVDSGMLYIGQTVQSLRLRLNGHYKERRGGRYISAAMRKYGKAAFVIEEIGRYESIDELNDAEVYFIDFYNTIAPNGFNIMAGGRNSRHSEETKAKIADLCVGRPSAFKGKHHSIESKRLLAASRLGKPMAEETKQKIAMTLTGEGNHFFGKTHTVEARVKIGEARAKQRGIKSGPYKKKVI